MPRPIDRLLGRDRDVTPPRYAVRPFGTTVSDAAAADQAAAGAAGGDATKPNLTTGTSRTTTGGVTNRGSSI